MKTDINATLSVSDTWQLVVAAEHRARDLRTHDFVWTKAEADTLDGIAERLRGLLTEWGRSE